MRSDHSQLLSGLCFQNCKRIPDIARPEADLAAEHGREAHQEEVLHRSSHVPGPCCSTGLRVPEHAWGSQLSPCGQHQFSGKRLWWHEAALVCVFVLVLSKAEVHVWGRCYNGSLQLLFPVVWHYNLSLAKRTPLLSYALSRAVTYQLWQMHFSNFFLII